MQAVQAAVVEAQVERLQARYPGVRESARCAVLLQSASSRKERAAPSNNTKHTTPQKTTT